MQGNVNPAPGGRSVLVEKTTEGIKRRGRICVQQGVAQPGLAGFAYRQVLSLVARVTETHFPIPCLEVIAKFSHLTTQPDVEELIPVSELFVPWTGIVQAAEPNTSGQRNRRSVNNQSRVPNCEGIERILDWDTDAERATRPYGRKRSSRNVEWIGRKWHSGQGCIEKRARIFEVGKHRQVLIAQVARERTVVHLTVSRRQVWRKGGEVEGEEIPISRNPICQFIKVRANTKYCRADIERRKIRVRS